MHCACLPGLLSCLCPPRISPETELTSLPSHGPWSRRLSHRPPRVPTPPMELPDPSALHRYGILLANWLDSPQLQDCPFERTTLTSEEIASATTVSHMVLPRSDGPTLYLPHFHIPSSQNITSWTIIYAHELQFWTTNELIAVRARGLYLHEDSDEEEEEEEDPYPHPGEFITALFKSQHELKGLQHIFVLDVGGETRKLVRGFYTYSESESRQPLVFGFGTGEYFEVLGSCVGCAVVQGMLAAWERGSKEVSRVVVYSEGERWNVRFDVETIHKVMAV